MTIKHIVLAGGGPAGFVTYGALRELHINKFWNISDIKSIYGCSIGANSTGTAILIAIAKLIDSSGKVL